MAEAAYDLPSEGDGATSFSTGAQLAGLATESLANSYSRTPPADVVGWQPLGPGWRFARHAFTAWLDFERQTRLARTVERPHAGASWTESPAMHSDQYLQFLAAAGMDEFLRPMVSRIKALSAAANEEEDQNGLKPESLAGLFRFLYVHKDRIEDAPQLVLTTEGHLRAEWRRSRDCRVAVRFIDRYSVSFVTFLPDRYVPTRVNRVGGDSSIVGFFENAGVRSLPSARKGIHRIGQHRR